MNRKTTMNTRLAWRTALLTASLLLGPSLHAAEIKVGFVNVARVLEKAPQAEAARTRIEKEFAPKDRSLVAQQKELRGLEDQLVRDGAVMTEEQRLKLESDIRARRREMRKSQAAFREELNLRRNQELSKLQRKVIQVIQEMAKAAKYDLVIGDGVLYASERIDITDKVSARLKEEGAN